MPDMLQRTSCAHYNHHGIDSAVHPGAVWMVETCMPAWLCLHLVSCARTTQHYNAYRQNQALSNSPAGQAHHARAAQLLQGHQLEAGDAAGALPHRACPHHMQHYRHRLPL